MCVAGLPVLVTGSASVTYGTTAGTPAVGNDARTIAGAAAAATATEAQTTANAALPLAGGQMAGPILSPPIAGATADYNFLQGSGTTLADITGNGNSGTLGASTLAPTWTSTGLSFAVANRVALPATLNASETFFIAAYISPLTSGTQVANVYPMLVASSLGGTGLNLLVDYSLNGGYVGHAGGGPFAPGIYAAGNNQSGSVVPIAGFHVLTYVLGAGSGSLDHFYVDGVEQPYDRQQHSAGNQASGNLFLGSSGVAPFAASGFYGTMYRFAALPTNALTAAQI